MENSRSMILRNWMLISAILIWKSGLPMILIIIWNTNLKNRKKDPLTWEDKDGKLTLKEYEGSSGNYYITYDLGIFREHVKKTETQKYLNTVILYVPENAELSEGDIHLSDGDLNAEQLLCEKMTVKLSNGDMNLDRGEFKDFEATLGDGELEIGDIRTGSLKLKTATVM